MAARRDPGGTAPAQRCLQTPGRVGVEATGVGTNAGSRSNEVADVSGKGSSGRSVRSSSEESAGPWVAAVRAANAAKARWLPVVEEDAGNALRLLSQRTQRVIRTRRPRLMWALTSPNGPMSTRLLRREKRSMETEHRRGPKNQRGRKLRRGPRLRRSATGARSRSRSRSRSMIRSQNHGQKRWPKGWPIRPRLLAVKMTPASFPA